MTEQKKPTLNATIRSFLLWFLTFYLIFWAYQSFFQTGNTDKASTTPTSIELVAAPSKLVLGKPLNLGIRNNTEQAWNYANFCDDGRRPLLQRLLNGQPALTHDYSQAECEAALGNEASLVVPAGETRWLSLGSINSDFFTEAGDYQVALPESVLAESDITEAVMAEVTYKKPGFIRRTFRSLITTPLFNLLAFLVEKIPGHSLGWAIVAMTLLVRLILVVPNQKAMRSQRKLQKLQPEIQSLKKKHGENQQALAMATMAMYKKHKINPMSSCWPILLQMPFLLGIYFVVQDGLRPHFQHLLYGFQENLDLSIVDNNFFGLDLSVPDILILPAIVGIAQFIAMKLAIPNLKKKEDSQKVTKKKKSDKPDMADQMQQMQRMMVWIMPLMIAFFTATFPAGVGIYWLTSTIFGIGQQKFVNWQLDKPKVKRKE